MGESATLTASFFARWTGAPVAGRGEGGLEEALAEMVEQGSGAWPGVPLRASLFAAFVGERAPADVEPVAAARSLRAGDLFLACACAHGVPEAIRAFDAQLLSKVPLYLRRLDVTAGLADETRSVLLDKLFVAKEGQPPKILQYGGRGSLEGWLRVATVNAAQNLLQSERSRQARSDEATAVAQALAPGGDPEIELMKTGYRDELVAALREAMTSLGQRDRALLRFAFVDQLTPARIGAIYGVHRTTAMRWLEAAQAEIRARTEARLMDRLRLSPSDCAGLFQLVQSRLELTLSSLLKAEP